MKIFLDQFCLASGEDELPKGLTINGKRQVQNVAWLRTTTAGVFPRGNRVNTIASAVVRRHTSVGAAEAFLCRHAARLPASGNLVLLCEEAEGEVVRYTAAASAVASDQGAQAEAVTTHRYTIVCGWSGEGGELGKPEDQMFEQVGTALRAVRGSSPETRNVNDQRPAIQRLNGQLGESSLPRTTDGEGPPSLP